MLAEVLLGPEWRKGAFLYYIVDNKEARTIIYSFYGKRLVHRASQSESLNGKGNAFKDLIIYDILYCSTVKEDEKKNKIYKRKTVKPKNGRTVKTLSRKLS